MSTSIALTSTFALLAVAAAAALPAPAHAAAVTACTLEGTYETTRTVTGLKRSASATFSVRGSAVCTGMVEGQPINPQRTSFTIEGRRVTVAGQPCLGSGQGRLKLRLLKRTGWVPLSAHVRMLIGSGGTLDGATSAGADPASLLGTSGFAANGAECSGGFTGRFTLTPRAAAR